MYKATENYKKLKIKIPVDKSLKNKSQTKNSNNKRHLNGLHNKRSSLKIKFV